MHGVHEKQQDKASKNQGVREPAQRAFVKNAFLEEQINKNRFDNEKNLSTEK